MSLPLRAEIFLPPNSSAVSAQEDDSVTGTQIKTENTHRKSRKPSRFSFDSHSVRETVVRIAAAVTVLAFAATAVFITIHLKESSDSAILSLVGNYTVQPNQTEASGGCLIISASSGGDSIRIEPQQRIQTNQNLHLKVFGIIFVTKSSSRMPENSDVTLDLAPVDGAGRQFTSNYLNQPISVTSTHFGLIFDAPDRSMSDEHSPSLCPNLGLIQCSSGPCSGTVSFKEYAILANTSIALLFFTLLVS